MMVIILCSKKTKSIYIRINIKILKLYKKARKFPLKVWIMGALGGRKGVE